MYDHRFVGPERENNRKLRNTRQNGDCVHTPYTEIVLDRLTLPIRPCCVVYDTEVHDCIAHKGELSYCFVYYHL